MNSITSITSTICKAMGISLPSISTDDVLEPVIRGAKEKGITTIDKCLVFSPDAIGIKLYHEHKTLFAKVLEHAHLSVPLRSVVPPKTPVYYASMFTGAAPEVHGIRQYEKPVLNCDTIFDAFIRAGKSVAIAAVKNSSIDCIFRDRSIDYFSETYDEQVTDRTIELLEAGNHDFILAYQQEYDDTLHQTNPRSAEAIRAVENHIKSFDQIASAFEYHNKKYNRLIIFAPDHGAHIDPVTGKGTHGEDIPEDMNIMHFFGISKGENM